MGVWETPSWAATSEISRRLVIARVLISSVDSIGTSLPTWHMDSLDPVMAWPTVVGETDKVLNIRSRLISSCVLRGLASGEGRVFT